MPYDMNLHAIFRMQDKAAGLNETRSDVVKQNLGIISDAVALVSEILTSATFADHKQHCLRVLGADALSSIITSVRVGLWGNLPESIVLLRCALETCAILAATVEERAYESVAFEIGSKRMSGHSYKASIAQLGDLGRRIDCLHGRLSDIGAHSSSTRFKFAAYECDGVWYDRIAAAIDPSSVELGLRWVPDVCLQLLQSLETAYLESGTAFPQAERLAVLQTRVSRIGDEQGALVTPRQAPGNLPATGTHDV
jgi:hypothetical protein